MKFVSIYLLLVANIAMGQDQTKKKYPQPMRPQGVKDITIIPDGGGEIFLNGDVEFTIPKGKRNLQKLDSDVGVNSSNINENKKEISSNKSNITNNLNSIKSLEKETAKATEAFKHDSMLSGVNKSNNLESKVENLIEKGKNELMSNNLKSYIDFKNRKALIGKFSGVEVNPIYSYNIKDNKNSKNIIFPKDKSMVYFENYGDSEFIIKDFHIDYVGGNPQGRKLKLTNNTTKYIKVEIGCSNCIAPKVGGVQSGGHIYIEPARTFNLVFNGVWWNRIGGYMGEKSIPNKTIGKNNLAKHITKDCTNVKSCTAYCPKGTMAIGSSCTLHEGEIGGMGEFYSDSNKGSGAYCLHAKPVTVDRIHLSVGCIKISNPD